MHIMPAATTKPISSGVNRVWAWICSEMEEERGITTQQRDGLFTAAIRPKPPTSHLTAHGGWQSHAHPSCLPWWSSECLWFKGIFVKIILSQILWKRAEDSYSAKLMWCRWSMKSQHLSELGASTKLPPLTTFKKCPLWVVSIFFFMLSCVFQVFYTEENTFKVFFLLPRLKKKKNLWCRTM